MRGDAPPPSPSSEVPEAPEPRASATVVLLRESPRGPEVLLLQRVSRQGRPGAWVFPGGKVEPVDRPGAAGAEPHEAPARRAAVRETREETGLAVGEAGLAPIARWITPAVRTRRFDTWFFLAPIERDAPVRVDGREIATHRWLPATDALEAHHVGAMPLAPPQFVTVSWLAAYPDPAGALEGLRTPSPLVIRPRICPREDGACMLYPGDAGYDDLDLVRPGPRHRLWAVRPRWVYEREG